MKGKLLSHGLVIVSVFTMRVWADAPFSDGFETATLNSWWTAVQANGTVLPSTAKAHTGLQGLQMARSTGGQLGLNLTHTFAQPQYGTVSVWFYDSGGGYYSYLTVENIALSRSSSIGVQDWDGAHYYYSGLSGTGGIAPGVSRSTGWHLLAMTVTPTSQTISFDGQAVYSGINTSGFERVTLMTMGPGGSGGYYYDDFTFTPMATPPAVQITSLTGNGSLTWTNVPALSNAVFSVEWAPNLAGGWSKSWGSLGGLLTTGLNTTVDVPMVFRVKAVPTQLLPFPMDYQMTFLVSNAVGNVSTQHIAVLGYARPLAGTNEFAVLEQDNNQAGIMLMRATDTCAYRYSPVSGGEVIEFQLGPVGTTWTNFNYEGSGYDTKATLEAIENVTVPAGTFLCYKFHKQTVGVAGSDRYEWICPQVGFIKWVDYWTDYAQNPPITYQLQSLARRN